MDKDFAKMNISRIEDSRCTKYSFIREWTQNNVRFSHKIFPNAFSMVITGKRNSGKTNLVFDMLLEDDFLDYNQLYIFSPSIYQPKYQLLIKGFENGLTKHEINGLFDMQDEINEDRQKQGKPKITDPEEMISYYTSNNDFVADPNPITVFAYSGFNDIPKVESVDKTKKNVFIFDDCATKNKTIIDSYFSRGRHSNIVCIYITQRYHELPLMIRDNTDIFIFFKLHNTQPLQFFHNNYCSNDMSIYEFRKYCNKCWSEPYNFAMIDTTKDDPNERYKMNFDIPLNSII